jgi:glycosyltransferase involved in cell wall biosynthesis
MENRLKRKKDNIILILMPYYNRPKDVLLALSSIKNQSYKNWRLAFVDDGSDEPGEDIVRGFFEEKDLDKVIFYNTGDTKEIKQKRIVFSKNLKIMIKNMKIGVKLEISI